MTGNSVEVTVNVRDAQRSLDAMAEAIDDGATDAVKQLAVLAESHMKAEAPEGSGRDVHLRDTIRTDFDRAGKKAVVRPHKKTSNGIPLVEIVTGNPDWTWENPPPIGPLKDWADAKVGDEGFAYYLQWKLVEQGSSFPDPFVDRSFQKWASQVEDIVDANLDSALDRAGGA